MLNIFIFLYLKMLFDKNRILNVVKLLCIWCIFNGFFIIVIFVILFFDVLILSLNFKKVYVGILMFFDSIILIIFFKICIMFKILFLLLVR